MVVRICTVGDAGETVAVFPTVSVSLNESGYVALVSPLSHVDETTVVAANGLLPTSAKGSDDTPVPASVIVGAEPSVSVVAYVRLIVEPMVAAVAVGHGLLDGGVKVTTGVPEIAGAVNWKTVDAMAVDWFPTLSVALRLIASVPGVSCPVTVYVQV